MNEQFLSKLLSMMPNMDEKKMSEAVDKAMDIMKKHDVNEIRDAIANSNLSAIMDESIPTDISKIIDTLPESKKLELWEKYNTPEVQEAIKTDKNKAMEMLQQILQK